MLKCSTHTSVSKILCVFFLLNKVTRLVQFIVVVVVVDVFVVVIVESKIEVRVERLARTTAYTHSTSKLP